jgi:hypothetical protein
MLCCAVLLTYTSLSRGMVLLLFVCLSFVLAGSRESGTITLLSKNSYFLFSLRKIFILYSYLSMVCTYSCTLSSNIQVQNLNPYFVLHVVGKAMDSEPSRNRRQWRWNDPTTRSRRGNKEYLATIVASFLSQFP